jgi:hypothetical protein
MIGDRARWESALACSRSQLAVEIACSLALLGLGIALRPRATTALIAAIGFAEGVALYVCNRLTLARPPFLRRIDWGSEPVSALPDRSSTAGLLVGAATAFSIAVVYLLTGKKLEILPAFVGGIFAAYALIAFAQRFYLERDFRRRFAARR